VALLAVMHEKPHDAAAFDKHYFEKHVPLAKKIPGLRKYEVSRSAVAAPAGPSNYHVIALLHYDDVAAIQNAFASAEGQAAVADAQNFATDGVGTSSCSTRARCETPPRNQNSGAKAAPLFFYFRPPLDTTVLDGFWRSTFKNSQRPQQNRAKEHEHGAHRQYIELQSKVHSSHLHQSCADGKASRPSLRAKANLLLRCRRIFLHDNVARDLLANVLRFDSNFFQMDGCACDYAFQCRGAPGIFA
jgi:uncharacterized protein (TIGR02118 family)